MKGILIYYFNLFIILVLIMPRGYAQSENCQNFFIFSQDTLYLKKTCESILNFNSKTEYESLLEKTTSISNINDIEICRNIGSSFKRFDDNYLKKIEDDDILYIYYSTSYHVCKLTLFKAQSDSVFMQYTDNERDSIFQFALRIEKCTDVDTVRSSSIPFELYNIDNPKKIKFLDDFTSINLCTYKYDSLSNYKIRNTYSDCYMLDLSENSAIIRYYRKDSLVEYEDLSSSLYTTNYYKRSFYETIDLKSIYFIEEYKNDLFSAVWSSAIVFSLIVPPLVSIDYKNNSFNFKRYKNYAFSSLGVATIFIPLDIIFNNKLYYLKNIKARTMKPKKIWKINVNP